MPKKTCFLIDDDQDDTEVFQLALEQINGGLECVTCINGIEALKKLSEESFNPDYIFLDMNMPLMSGEECLTAMRKLSRIRKVPIFIYTTNSHLEKATLHAKGATDVITKPVKLSELVNVLHDCFTKDYA